MYVVLTDKPGEYHTEVDERMEVLERYDYVFCGRTRAQYRIARVLDDGPVRIIEDAEPYAVNRVPAKLLPKFDTLEAARADLHSLCGKGRLDIALIARAPR